MPRPGEDRSDVGGAAQFNNIGPVPLPACPAFRALSRFPPVSRFPARVVAGLLVSAGVHEHAAQTVARPPPPRPELNPPACRHHDRRHLTFIGTSFPSYLAQGQTEFLVN